MKKTAYIMVSGLLAVHAWLVMFGMGLLVASKTYREQLLQSFDWKAFFISLLTYTPTNIAALCLLAAFCGGCASRMVIASAAALHPGKESSKSADSHSDVYMTESSMLRGFVVYVAFLAGVYVGTNAPFADPTQEQYARAAGTVSLLAFVVGYDPSLFRQFLNIGSKLKGS
jgi:hypothetical protein